MGEAEDIEQIVRVLKRVPEKRLMIIELANTIPIKGGELDINVLQAKQPEVNLAIAEAKAYGVHTMQAVDALVRLKGQPALPELRPLEEEDLEAGLQF